MLKICLISEKFKMIDRFVKYLNKTKFQTGASEDQLFSFNRNYINMFTSDYWEFMKLSNGYEGSVGESYLQLWPIEEINPYNIDARELLEEAPELTIFGSDGGGMVFCYDNLNHYYVEIPLEAISEKYKEICGESFIDFLVYLFNRDETYRY
jgi:hypothetical protein